MGVAELATYSGSDSPHADPIIFPLLGCVRWLFYFKGQITVWMPFPCSFFYQHTKLLTIGSANKRRKYKMKNDSLIF